MGERAAIKAQRRANRTAAAVRAATLTPEMRVKYLQSLVDRRLIRVKDAERVNHGLP